MAIAAEQWLSASVTLNKEQLCAHKERSRPERSSTARSRRRGGEPGSGSGGDRSVEVPLMEKETVGGWRKRGWGSFIFDSQSVGQRVWAARSEGAAGHWRAAAAAGDEASHLCDRRAKPGRHVVAASTMEAECPLCQSVWAFLTLGRQHVLKEEAVYLWWFRFFTPPISLNWPVLSEMTVAISNSLDSKSAGLLWQPTRCQHPAGSVATLWRCLWKL